MRRNLIASTFACALLVPTFAFAHSQSAPNGFLPGFAHPFIGADHLLAMLMVGVVAARIGTRATWMLPLTFVASMVVGGTLALLGVSMPAVEPMVAASVLLLGSMVMLDAKVHVHCAAALVAGLALFHGVAHGVEARGSETLLAYVAGFTLATALLHLAGICTARSLARRLEVLRIAAAPIAFFGAWMLVNRVA